MTTTDPYLNPDLQTDSTLAAMVTRLEERGRHSGFLEMIEEYVATLPTDRALTVLDVGCGTGVVARQVCKAIHPFSTIHGADISKALLGEARKLDATGRIQWDHIGAKEWPYQDSTFDVVLMHTLLSHVTSPATLLAEAARVLRPRGQLIVFDADHASTTYAQPDYETTRRIDHLLATAISAHLIFAAACRDYCGKHNLT